MRVERQWLGDDVPVVLERRDHHPYQRGHHHERPDGQEEVGETAEDRVADRTLLLGGLRRRAAPRSTAGGGPLVLHHHMSHDQNSIRSRRVTRSWTAAMSIVKIASVTPRAHA